MVGNLYNYMCTHSGFCRATPSPPSPSLLPPPPCFSANWFIFLNVDYQTKIDRILTMQFWASWQSRHKYLRQHCGGSKLVGETGYNCMPRVYFVKLGRKSEFMTKFVAAHALHLTWKFTRRFLETKIVFIVSYNSQLKKVWCKNGGYRDTRGGPSWHMYQSQPC